MGCKPRKKYEMRFIGWKDGKLIPTAPDVKQGEISKNFLYMADFPYWELVEPVPELVLPEAREEDGVFIAEVFVSEEELEEAEEPILVEVPEEDTHGKDASEEEIQLTLVPEEAPEEEIPEEQEAPEDYGKLTVDELKERITGLDGEVKSYWRKASLIKELERLSEA